LPGARYGGFVLLAALPFLLVQLAEPWLYVVLETSAYLVFHNLAEIFSVVVPFSIFGLGWFSFRESGDRRALFLSAGFLAIGLLDILHTLGYSGMPALVTVNTVNKAVEYWLAARAVTAAVLLTAAFVRSDSPSPMLRRPVLLAAALLLPAAVFTLVTWHPEALPAAFVPEQGLTDFKKAAELAIIAGFAAAGLATLGHRADDPMRSALWAALVLCTLTEAVFTAYHSAFDTFNMLGHLYKIAAFGLIYRAVFLASVRRPYDDLQQSVREKETLLRELYHRTKNTLQMIQGLVVLQASEAAEDPAVQELVRKTEDRIQAISLVHQKLYSTRDLSRIPLKAYIEDLAALVVRGYGGDDAPVRLEVEAEDRSLLIDTAVPFGLILNELITNSLKYAFPDGKPGSIRIALKPSGPGRLNLDYRDDGVGLPPRRGAFAPRKPGPESGEDDRQPAAQGPGDPGGNGGLPLHGGLPRQPLPGQGLAMAVTVLLVEDEVILAMALTLELRREGFAVSDHVTTGEEALAAAEENPLDLVLMDIRLAGEMDGIEAARRIRAHRPLPVCFMSGYSDDRTRVRAGEVGAIGYLLKPFPITQFKDLVKSLRPSG